MAEITLSIGNWDKHQDVKEDRKLKPNQRHHWLKLSNTIYRSYSLHLLSSEEKWVWVTILCLCSQKGSGELKFTPEWFEWETRIPKNILLSCLEKLESTGAVALVRHNCDTSATLVQHKCVTEEIRGEEKREEVGNELLQSSEPLLEPDSASPPQFEELPCTFDPIVERFVRENKVKAKLIGLWLKTYENNAAWIEQELLKAMTYLEANPQKRPKSNWARFLGSWLSRGWEYRRKSLPTNSQNVLHLNGRRIHV